MRLKPHESIGVTVLMPDLVFLADCRAEVRLSAASEATRVGWGDGSGAGFGLSFKLVGRSRDFTPTTPDFGHEVKKKNFELRLPMLGKPDRA